MNQAKEYAETNAIQFRHVAELVDEFPKEFKKMKGRIIDIGCGPGNITRDVLLPNVDKDAVIVGADVCANMIEYAKQHYGVDDKLSYLQLDIQTPELPENLIEHFDNAVSFYALHWCKNTKQVLKNIYKLLRPGGKAIILTISHHMIYDMYPEQENDPRFAPYVKNSMKWAPPHQGCSDAEQIMKKDLIEAKFNVEYCTNKWETFKYPSFEAFMDLVMAVNPFVHLMPIDVQKEYRKDMEERLKSQCPVSKKDNTTDCRVSILTTIIQKPPISEEIDFNRHV